MKQKELEVLIEGLRKLSAVAAEIADRLSAAEAPEAAPSEEIPARVCTKEEVRAILADKVRAGFRAEVKAILTSYGAKQLSDITDPKELAAVYAEAEVIGNG